MTEKAAFRADIKARTAALSLVYLADSDRGILKSLLALPEFQAARRVFLYISFGREVDTRALIDLCRKLKKPVAAPTNLNAGRMGLDELAQWIEDNKLHFAHWFTVDDLKFIKRGGRVSATAALVGTVLSVKPIMHVDNEGKLIPVDKVRGRRKSLEELVAHMEKSAIRPADQTVFISHGGTPEDAAYIEKLVRERLGVKNVFIGPVGPVVGSHGGPGIICLFFLAEER